MDVEVDVRKLSSRITMNVRLRGLRAWRWQVWVARQLIGLAAWVLGTGIEIVEVSIDGVD